MRRPSVPHLLWRLMVAAAAASLALLIVITPASAAGGPKLVKDINPTGSSFPTSLTQVGSTLFFAANDGVHGVELWKSDGTAAGTKMVKDIHPGSKSSWPENLVNVNGTLFFFADDGVHGNELWKSNGTAAGTKMVKDIHPGPKGQFGGNSTQVYGPPVVVGSRIFFIVEVGDYGTAPCTSAMAPKAVRTRPPRTMPSNQFFPPEYGSRARPAVSYYFVTLEPTDAVRGIEHLWVSDGTAAGTHRQAGSPTAKRMSILPVNGSEALLLHRSPLAHRWHQGGHEGVDQGAASRPSRQKPRCTWANGCTSARAACSARCGRQRHAERNEADIGRGGGRPGQCGGLVYWSSHGYLEVSDGTGAGMRDLALVGTWPLPLVAVNGGVCFVAQDYDAGTAQLWVSNGTTAGTHPIASFLSSPATEQLGAAVGNKFFFAADDGVHGVELWSYTP